MAYTCSVTSPAGVSELQQSLAATQAAPEPEVLQPQERVTPPATSSEREIVESNPQPRTEEKPVVAAKPVTRTYTVKKGETLYSIAKRHGVSVDAVSKASGIADPAKIAAGQTLIIPSR